MLRYLTVMLVYVTIFALCACSSSRHVVSLIRCGKIELLDVRYDQTLGDSSCRVIVDVRAADTNGVLQSTEYWYQMSSDYSAVLFDVKTVRLEPEVADTIVIPSTIYRFSFRFQGSRDLMVHSFDLPFYHSHEYRLRAFIEPICAKQGVIP